MYGIPTFDSESFELELNGSAWRDTSGSRFVQIPSVVLEIRFRPMYTMSGLPLDYLKRLVIVTSRKGPVYPIVNNPRYTALAPTHSGLIHLRESATADVSTQTRNRRDGRNPQRAL